MPLPNFFVIGAPKAGTTALYHCLRQHPNVYMSPIKEPYYFAFDGEPPVFAGPGGKYFRRAAVWKPSDYLSLFAKVTCERAVGEASSLYLWTPLAAQQIRNNVPHAKLIAILRQPVDRAYSNYWHIKRSGVESERTFVEALRLEKSRQQEGWPGYYFYRQQGYYYTQLRLWFDLFPREQIQVHLYEDWNTVPHTLLRDLFRFLEVDENFTPELKRRNVTQISRLPSLNWHATRPAILERTLTPLLPTRLQDWLTAGLRAFNTRFNLTTPPPLDPELRRQLTTDFRDEILKLQDLLQRDLSHWLQ